MKTVKSTPRTSGLAYLFAVALAAIGLQETPRKLRSDTRGEIGTFVVGLITILVLIIVVAALIPTIVTNIYAANSSLNAGERALMALVPLLVVVALILVIVFWALQKHHAG